MHNHYTALVTSLSSQISRVKADAGVLTEEKNVLRREGERLMREVGEGRREVERLEGVVGKMREECNLARGVRVRMQWEMGRMRDEVERLRKVSGRGEGEEYPGDIVDAVRKEMSDNLEVQVASCECSFSFLIFCFRRVLVSFLRVVRYSGLTSLSQ
jgi:predicted nuclease with TOPRIM domain